MCIALLSTAHPSYKLILIDNRDEYLNRPTAPATWWPASNDTNSTDTHVLSGRDLLRSIQGTWLGITTTGKIAVLTNFREPTPPSPTATSRGAIIRQWLTSSPSTTTSTFVTDTITTGLAHDAGGFSLVCGTIGEKLAVISNRASSESEVPWICGDTVQTVGLSNAAFTDRTWRKVIDGEELMLNAIRKNVAERGGEDELIADFLELLSVDTLERVDRERDGYATYVTELRNTIFVPPLGRRDTLLNRRWMRGDELAAARTEEEVEVAVNGDDVVNHEEELGVSGLYGTQKQTVVLVDHDMNVRFFERTLFDDVPNPIPIGKGDVDIKFKIQK